MKGHPVGPDCNIGGVKKTLKVLRNHSNMGEFLGNFMVLAFFWCVLFSKQVKLSCEGLFGCGCHKTVNALQKRKAEWMC